jgi:hypothetical protein
MKKVKFLFVAAAAAIAFSAFTTVKPQPTYWYKTTGGFAIFSGTPCPPATDAVCIRMQPGVGNVTVLKSQNESDPLKYNP